MNDSEQDFTDISALTSSEWRAYTDKRLKEIDSRLTVSDGKQDKIIAALFPPGIESDGVLPRLMETAVNMDRFILLCCKLGRFLVKAAVVSVPFFTIAKSMGWI